MPAPTPLGPAVLSRPETHAAAAWSQWHAPADWRTLAFLSDVHLHPEAPSTHQEWLRALEAIQAHALFILGDLLEAWVGDDALDHPLHGPFWHGCVQALHGVAQRMPVFLLPGNRDFLLGPRFARLAGLTLLADPTVLQWAGGCWLLTHGDALCTSDHAYQHFRAHVRSAPWQADFAARPLAERLALAAQMRAQSRAHQAGRPPTDIDLPTATQWLETALATVLVHGHTHRPALHALSARHWRAALSDWDADAHPPRLHWLLAHAPAPGAAGPAPPIFEIKNAFTA